MRSITWRSPLPCANDNFISEICEHLAAAAARAPKYCMANCFDFALQGKDAIGTVYAMQPAYCRADALSKVLHRYATKSIISKILVNMDNYLPIRCDWAFGPENEISNAGRSPVHSLGGINYFGVILNYAAHSIRASGDSE